MAGRTIDYGYTSFGSDVTTPGYVSEDPDQASRLLQRRHLHLHLPHAIPANATGTYSIGIEARKVFTLNAGTTKQTTQQVRRHQPRSQLLRGWLAGNAAPHRGGADDLQ